jgi:NAD(P)-dependent dehydrogenase (short-subunit alcohol dehydrogenase family)
MSFNRTLRQFPPDRTADPFDANEIPPPPAPRYAASRPSRRSRRSRPRMRPRRSPSSNRPLLEDPALEDVEPVYRTLNVLPAPYLEPDDITSTVLFLTSDEARYVTGVAPPVDAGYAIK